MFHFQCSCNKLKKLLLKFPDLYFIFVSLGSMRELDVIDVARQDDITMRMREWTEYYENQRPRDKVLNVISLEFSGTE